jgi:hypothetical protein
VWLRFEPVRRYETVASSVLIRVPEELARNWPGILAQRGFAVGPISWGPPFVNSTTVLPYGRLRKDRRNVYIASRLYTEEFQGGGLRHEGGYFLWISFGRKDEPLMRELEQILLGLGAEIEPPLRPLADYERVRTWWGGSRLRLIDGQGKEGGKRGHY